jgi:allantoate deiminase
MGVEPYSEADGMLVRRFLTPAHDEALKTLAFWMEQAGMTARRDHAGNLVGRYEGETPDAPALLIGSHIDSVRNGGRYDGALGVMLGIDVVEALSAAGRRLPFAVEVIAFGDEEGSRFPASMTCSRAVAGTVKPSVMEMTDGDGVSLAEAFAAFALDPTRLEEAARKPGEVFAFLEAHIEQGPVLEAEGLALGVVTAIAAQKRLMVRFTGMAGHAGTTPMNLRKDPGPAAAEAILALERICAAGQDGLVGTVGRITALPGAFNVIPGRGRIFDGRPGRGRRHPRRRRRGRHRRDPGHRRAARPGGLGHPDAGPGRQPLRSWPDRPAGRPPSPPPARRRAACPAGPATTPWSSPTSAPPPCCSSAARAGSATIRARP